MRFAVIASLVVAGAVSLVFAQTNSNDWRTYGQNSQGWRYSELAQIDTRNVSRLSTAWIYQTGLAGGFETTPLVFDGLMFIAGPSNHSWALDALTGRPIWHTHTTPPVKLNLCCGQVNRGFATRGDKLFRLNIEGKLVALDAKSGTTLWETTVADYKQGYSATAAPLIVKNLVVTGIAGAEFGTRGFIDAYDADTGKRVWRFNTVPADGEPGGATWSGDSWKRGGASTWITGTYDPESNLIFWGTGNPGPDMDGDVRRGDNLFSCSVVAIDADTGKLKWYYQFSPHDEFDYDATQVPVLADMQWKGSPRKVMLWANRNGFFYVLDRATGQFLLGKPFVEVNWATGFDEKGRPQRVPGMVPTAQGTTILPGNQGGTNWYNPSYSPKTGLFYVPTWVNYSSLYVKQPEDYVEGRPFRGGTPRPTTPNGIRSTVNNYAKEEEGYGAIRAIDPHTGDMKWQFKMTDVTDAGVLTTASNLLFSGGREGYFYALDARDGKLLWKFPVGGRVVAGPMTFSLAGRQYVSIAAGNSLFTFALKQ